MTNTAPVKFLRPGCIIEFLHNNQPIIAWVEEVQSNRVKIFTLNQREVKLPLSRVLPWYGPDGGDGASREEILTALRAHHARRERLTDEIDPLEIWEMAQGELTRASIFWFADLIWEAPDVDRVAALGRKLLQTKTHFKFLPPDFEVYPEDKVERRLAELKAAQERERLIGLGQVLLKALYEKHSKGRPLTVNPDPDVASRIKDLLLTRMAWPEDKDSETVWQKMSAGLPDDPFLPLHLAQAWGVVPRHYNFLLDRAQYTWSPDWQETHGNAIAALKSRAAARMTEPEPWEPVTVDSASTEDIDDGFHLERTDSGYRLRLVLACPALEWEFGSALDKAVENRFTSLYLPEGTSHMLPRELGTGFFSLQADGPRPALILTCLLDESGRLTEFSPRQGTVRVRANLTYTGVEEDLTSTAPDPMLAMARELTEKLRAARIADRAVIMDQPDPELVLTGNNDSTRVELRQRPDTPLAQMIVSEFMILANSGIARWALDKEIPLLFRTQNLTLPGGSAGIWSRPEDIYRLIKNMGPSILECTAKRHATIGVEAYAPITSPLRRYSDFMNLAQVLYVLKNGTPRWDRATLKEILPVLSSRIELVNQVQRMRPRYWKALYFKQNCKKQKWSGVIVDANSHLVTVALFREQLFLKAPRSIFGDKVRIGQRFMVRIGKVDPLNNDIKIVEAWEE
jgi:exoribonuclease-2